MKTAKYDLAIAARFKEFRKKHISNNSNDVAVELGIPQSRISRIENGQQPVTMELIRVMTKKYGLNSDWLLYNVGKDTDKVKKANTLEKSIELQERVESLISEVKILSFNQSKLWNLVEQQGKIIEQQGKLIENLKNK